MTYAPPQGVVNASWAGADPYSPPSNPQHNWWGDEDHGVGIRRLAPPGWSALAVDGGGRLFRDWEYPPPFLTIHASWQGALAYARPEVVVDAAWRMPAGADGAVVEVSAQDTSAFGLAQVSNTRRVQPHGWVSLEASAEHLVEQVHVCNGSWLGAPAYAPPGPLLVYGWWAGVAQGWIRPAGFRAGGLGLPRVANDAEGVWPSGVAPTLAWGSARVWNFHSFVVLANRGPNTQAFGAAYVQGGVKTVAPPGRDQALYGKPVVINTMGEQLVVLGRADSIAPPPVPQPLVRPYIVWPSGIAGTAVGVARVQFPPRPPGWLSSAFGYPVVEYKSRWVYPPGIDSFATGFASVRDRAQRVLHRSQITTDVFGDVALRLKNSRVWVQAIAAEVTGPWTEVRNMRRQVWAQAWAATAWGANTIHNKTPALWPAGLDALRVGLPALGYRVRFVFPAGAIPPYPHTGLHSLWQTPALRPAGLAAPALASPVVWPRVRTVWPTGSNMQRVSDAAMVAPRWRLVVLEGKGVAGLSMGNARIEDTTRRIPVLGRNLLVFGSSWVSHGTRALDVAGQGIEPPELSSHRVGFTRQVAPYGFEATRWLSTIVPPAMYLYPRSFSTLFGLARAEHYKRYLLLRGITTYPEPQMHWGSARVWNSRQYIVQEEDQQGDLWPPAGSVWTLVENRNRTPRPLGLVATRYGHTVVENGARVLQPRAVAPPALPVWQKTGMVSHGVRRLPVPALEPPVVSYWLRVFNKAVPLAPPGWDSATFGQAEVLNTRRYRQINGFSPSAYGYPMVAPRIRRLTFEQRYGIHPPVLALPQVFLGSRYVEPPSIELPQASVLHELESRINRIITKWDQRDRFGEAVLRKLTPELLTRGYAMDEAGLPQVRLQWRALAADGVDMQWFGRAVVADRTRAIVVAGWQSMVVSDKLRFRRIGADPVVPQYIDLRRFMVNDVTGEVWESEEGYGIPPPTKQVPAPDLLKGWVFPISAADNGDMLTMGRPVVAANTIRVEPGYHNLYPTKPTVSLRHRTIAVPSLGVLVVDAANSNGKIAHGSWGALRVSPWTIYAVTEAPEQAVRNHEHTKALIHFVNTGAKAGFPRVSQYLGVLKPSGIRPEGAHGGAFGFWGMGSPQVLSMRRYIETFGDVMTRTGWPTIPGTRLLEVEKPSDTMALGRPSVGRPAPPPQLSPPGIAAGVAGTPRVGHFHRTLAPRAWLSQAMGSSQGLASGGTNMPNALHVGPPNLHEQDGFDASAFGNAWASHKVREVLARGHESFLSEYDLENFEARMRVRNASSGLPAPRPVATVGAVASASGVPVVRAGRHYIRPDGNAEQYRKGAPTT